MLQKFIITVERHEKIIQHFIDNIRSLQPLHVFKWTTDHSTVYYNMQETYNGAALRYDYQDADSDIPKEYSSW